MSDLISTNKGTWLTEYTEEEVKKEFPNITKYNILDDLISRADAIEALGEEPEIILDTDAEWEMHDRWVDAMTSMKSLPSAEAVQGEWIDREHCQVDEDAYEIATCSHCKAEITLEYPNDNFCPNCGAMMVREDGEA